MFCFPLFWTVKTLELVRNFSFYFFSSSFLFLWYETCIPWNSSSETCQLEVSSISSKQEDNWNPSWVTAMFPAEETDRPSKTERTLKCKRTFAVLFPSYFNIYSNSLDQPTGPKRQIARYTWKTDRSRNVSIFLHPVKVPNPSVYNTAHQPGCWGARRHADPMAIHQLVSLLKIITATC